MMPALSVQRRWFPRIIRLRAEYYEYVEDPRGFVAQLKAQGGADIFTFLQSPTDPVPRDDWPHRTEAIAVLPITSFENWWGRQINAKTRNMIRRAEKSGLVLRAAAFSEEFVRGIKAIYDETPVRQGKPFRHYHKDLDTLRREHGAYLDRSEFVGAYAGAELVGFLKLVHGRGISNVMNILAKVAARDQAPTNALLARAVQLCASRQVSRLHYGLWSRRGLGDFKRHHGFQPLEVIRYFAPLNWRGAVALQLQCHRPFAEIVPGRLLDWYARGRSRWHGGRTGAQVISGQ